jgi:hypothetical protein
MNAKPSQGMTLSYTFQIDNLAPPLPGEPLAGSFTVEETEFTNLPGGSGSVDLTSFDFQFTGVPFDLTADPTATATFDSGTILGIDLSIGMGGFDPIAFSFQSAFPPFFSAQFNYDLTGGGGDAGSGDITFQLADNTQSVPEPSFLFGLLITAGIAIRMKR